MDYDAITTTCYSALAVSTLICIGAFSYCGVLLKRMQKDINEIQRVIKSIRANTKTLEAEVN